ncbi:hypothetical protein JVT61DRAFT_3204 [Boletus reticuloceps]|uniref:Uncharacterized protein n=1 Tax=Boletus reticuloceps TaxID=495285 RepID=A0A8I3AAF8_9AGAM|nr:hypothetical protein JVT61DRAFT_3204 [Boletus reticuloceps]
MKSTENELDLQFHTDLQVRAEIRASMAGQINGWERKRVNKQEVALEPTMDWFINADVRPGAGCRCEVVNMFFDNEATGETLSISGHR